MTDRPSRRADLPDDLRRLVDEIETEMGEAGDGVDGRGVPVGDVDLPVPIARLEIEGVSAVAPTGERGARVEEAVRHSLAEIGEDPERPGLAGTPARVHRMYRELTAGYHVDPDRLINGAIFEVDYSEMVVVKEIPFYSLCEHHLLPFFGQAAVAYIPRGRVVGLSKIPRIVEMYARRLQVQERMTQQVADFLMERLDPKGVGVVLEASHLCAVMRGIRKPGTVMTTAAVLGLFRTSEKSRAEFFAHIARPAPTA
jgi:GTP cyclohydrolase I